MTIAPPSPRRDRGQAPDRRRPFALLPLLVLCLLAGIIFAERYYTRQEPLDRDIATYAVVANEVRHGRALYADVFDQKPPAVYATLEAAELLTGYDRPMVFLLGVVTALVSLIGIYCLGSALSGAPTYGLWAAAFWTLLCSDMRLEANQPNTEAFMNACLIWALALLARARPAVVPVRGAVGVGLLLAWASLYKPVILSDAALVLAAYAAFPPNGPRDRRPALSRALVAGAVIGGVWCAVVLFLAARGHFHAFYDAMVVYNRSYAGSLKHNFRISLAPQYLQPSFLHFCLPLALLAVAGGGVVIVRRQEAWSWAMLAAYAVGTYAAVTLPGRFYPHYYQLWLPLLSAAPALALAALAQATGRAWLAPLAGALALLVLVKHEAPFYRLPPTEWCQQKYMPLDNFVAAEQTAHEIKSLLAPGETFYDVGTEPELYLTAGVRPPSGIFYDEPLRGGPFVAPFTQRVLRDLGRTRPAVVVERSGYPKNPAIWAWVQAHYRPLRDPQSHPPFVLWVSRDQAKVSGR